MRGLKFLAFFRKVEKMGDVNQAVQDAAAVAGTVVSDINTAAAAPTNHEKASDAAVGLADAIEGGMKVLKDLGVIDQKLADHGTSVAELIAVFAKVFSGIHL